jgi:hypothetical protein
MATEVIITADFENWWDGLAVEEQKSVAVVVAMLEERGRFHSLQLRHHVLHETVRVSTCRQTEPGTLCPKLNAILLLGGNKAGTGRGYDTHVPKARSCAYLRESGRAE